MKTPKNIAQLKKRFARSLLLFLLGGGQVLQCIADAPSTLFLLSQALVDSQGVFLDQVLANNPAQPWPHIRLGDAPAFGQAMVLGRAQIQALVRTNAPELATNTWAGADRVRLLRRVQALNESELKTMLQATLQKEYVRERGELELRFSRAWLPINVPDEPLELKVLDMPLAGVTANFIVRFELRTGKEVVGNWQVVAQARIWQELWVAAGPLKRGQLLGAHDLTRERRDVLAARDALIDLPAEERQLEMTENLPAGAPLTLRSVRARQLVHRGDVIEALAQDGLMTISLRVEALEPGAQGQVIRVRNPVSKREFRGKVQNEQTVMVSI